MRSTISLPSGHRTSSDVVTGGRGWAADRAAAAVEFALLLPVLLLIVFAIIDFGRLYNANIVLSETAREGVRAAMVSEADVSDRVSRSSAPLAVTWKYGTDGSCTGAASGRAVEVIVEHQFQSATPVGAVAAMFGKGFGGIIPMSSKAVASCQ